MILSYKTYDIDITTDDTKKIYLETSVFTNQVLTKPWCVFQEATSQCITLEEVLFGMNSSFQKSHHVLEGEAIEIPRRSI